ncbi:hypothetical protein K7X08_012645 [Anisodus acutangulus]|uniref:Uncharacterized protein n=1 Tax=Anisodus acutangulus TaxID=402998 RepID=A0A9Q1MA22_9SOLA|nr:hypothetical protein K7X08_012645 [Anisodus acutangulus]
MDKFQRGKSAPAKQNRGKSMPPKQTFKPTGAIFGVDKPHPSNYIDNVEQSGDLENDKDVEREDVVGNAEEKYEAEPLIHGDRETNSNENDPINIIMDDGDDRHEAQIADTDNQENIATP